MELDASKSYVLWWSGGNDSTLLLAKLRDQPRDFAIYTFRQLWTKEQARKSDELIKRWNLKVFSFPAASVNFIGKGNELSAVFEMAVGTGRTPIVADLIDGDKCILTTSDIRMAHEPFKFDVHIVGSRGTDSHYSLDKFVPGERWTQNDVEFWAPLYDYTREAVKRELRARKLDDSEADEREDTGNISICHRCIKSTEPVFCPKEGKTIDSVTWDRDLNLSQFRANYG